FTIFLASLLPESQLFSIEGAKEAVHFAEKNIKHLGMQNRITPACGDVLKTLSKVPSTLSTPDLVVLDPPRAGAKKEVCKKLIAAHPQAIIYIACDPTSLARDTKTLVAEGYHIQSLTGFDIYPMTHHVETVCLFVPSKERL
ncbi:MAG: RsmD family RNA methyltransferase, partial [Butyrivibrio sp.]|nr:RsmD family RNA methyltransferase [Butyrivibrio sp.]